MVEATAAAAMAEGATAEGARAAAGMAVVVRAAAAKRCRGLTGWNCHDGVPFAVRSLWNLLGSTVIEPEYTNNDRSVTAT